MGKNTRRGEREKPEAHFLRRGKNLSLSRLVAKRQGKKKKKKKKKKRAIVNLGIWHGHFGHAF